MFLTSIPLLQLWVKFILGAILLSWALPEYSETVHNCSFSFPSKVRDALRRCIFIFKFLARAALRIFYSFSFTNNRQKNLQLNLLRWNVFFIKMLWRLRLQWIYVRKNPLCWFPNLTWNLGVWRFNWSVGIHFVCLKKCLWCLWETCFSRTFCSFSSKW